jgi:CRISPR type III-A-associated RAMP protein Csm4
LVPLGVIHNLMHDKPPSEENWIVDGQSGCLLAVGRGGMATGPFRILRRTTAAVDRLTGVPGPASDVAVAQFLPQAGLWFVAAFASDEAQSVWGPRLESALRLLADTGFGGRRSQGFGRTAAPEIRRGELSALLGMTGKPNGETTAWWMLSLFVPAESDQVDWSQGHYSMTNRGGRIESQAGWGTEKKSLRMVTEGSVLLAAAAPVGTAKDVAPEGFAHPVFRAGFALPVPISWRVGE